LITFSELTTELKLYTLNTGVDRLLWCHVKPIVLLITTLKVRGSFRL